MNCLNDQRSGQTLNLTMRINEANLVLPRRYGPHIFSMKKQVFWNEQLLGWVIDPTVDNFELYGSWKAHDIELVNKFNKTLENEEEGLVVTFGEGKNKIEGTVFFEIEDEISIRMNS